MVSMLHETSSSWTTGASASGLGRNHVICCAPPSEVGLPVYGLQPVSVCVFVFAPPSEVGVGSPYGFSYGGLPGSAMHLFVHVLL